jgi:hypothetical protein
LAKHEALPDEALPAEAVSPIPVPAPAPAAAADCPKIRLAGPDNAFARRRATASQGENAHRRDFPD